MNESVYKLMNWPEIEAVVYSEHDNPHQVLGPRVTEEGILFGAFDPDAKEVYVKTQKGSFAMEKEDEGGYFAAILPGKKVPKYTLRFVYEEGERVCEDAYRFAPQITEDIEAGFPQRE